MIFQNPQLGDQWGAHVHEPTRADQIVLHLGNQMGGDGKAEMNSGHLPKSSVLQTNLVRSNEDHAMQTQIENHQFESSKVSGSSNVTHGGQVATDNSGVSQIMSPSIAIFSPNRYSRFEWLINTINMAPLLLVFLVINFCYYFRYPQEGDLDSEFRYSGRGSISLAEVNNTSSSKQVSTMTNEVSFKIVLWVLCNVTQKN